MTCSTSLSQEPLPKFEEPPLSHCSPCACVLPSFDVSVFSLHTIIFGRRPILLVRTTRSVPRAKALGFATIAKANATLLLRVDPTIRFDIISNERLFGPVQWPPHRAGETSSCVRACHATGEGEIRGTARTYKNFSLATDQHEKVGSKNVVSLVFRCYAQTRRCLAHRPPLTPSRRRPPHP